jgi:hypothetical protein
MEGSEPIFSLDDIPLRTKVKELLSFTDYDTDVYNVINFDDVAVDVFIKTYQRIYPHDKLPMVKTHSSAPLIDPLLSDILGDKGQEDRIEHVIGGLRRVAKRLFGSGTLRDTNDPKKDTSSVSRPRSASATRGGRPGSAVGSNTNNNRSNDNKKHMNKNGKGQHQQQHGGGHATPGKVKSYTSEDIFRRSLGGEDRSSLVNRVLTTSRSSTLGKAGEVLAMNIRANAGNSKKLLDSITAAEVVEGDTRATGVMIGLVYQEWYRVLVLEGGWRRTAMGIMSPPRSRAPSPVQNKKGGGGCPDLAGAPDAAAGTETETETETEGGKMKKQQQKQANKKKKAKASVFQPSGGFTKDPRDPRLSSRMVPLKFQHDPKMRERETLYIVSLHDVDPLRAHRLEEDREMKEIERAEKKKRRQRAAEAARMKEEEEEERKMEVTYLGHAMVYKERTDDDIERVPENPDEDKVFPILAPYFQSELHKEHVEEERRHHPHPHPRKHKEEGAGRRGSSKGKKSSKKPKQVNTRSCDTPSNPFVEHVVMWEPPLLAPGQKEMGPRHVRRSRTRDKVEARLRTLSPDGMKLAVPVPMPSRSPSPTNTRTITSTAAAAAATAVGESKERGGGARTALDLLQDDTSEPPKQPQQGKSPLQTAGKNTKRNSNSNKPTAPAVVKVNVEVMTPRDGESIHRPSSPQRLAAESAVSEVTALVSARITGNKAGAHASGDVPASDGIDGVGADEDDDDYADEFDEYGDDDFEREAEQHQHDVADQMAATDRSEVAAAQQQGEPAHPYSLDMANMSGTGGDGDAVTGPDTGNTTSSHPYGHFKPERKRTVRATSPSLYQPRTVILPAGYRPHDPDEWGPPLRKKSVPTELRDVVNFNMKHKGFGQFLLDKLVHKTSNATGGGDTKGDNGRPSSAGPALGRGGNGKKKKRANTTRGKSSSRSSSGKQQSGSPSRDGAKKQHDGNHNSQSGTFDYDAADALSEAGSTDMDDELVGGKRHGRGKPTFTDKAAFPARPLDRAYLEASMSVEVLGGEISDVIDPKQIPRVRSVLPSKSGHSKHKNNKSKRSDGRPSTAPSRRSRSTSRLNEGKNEDIGSDDEDDVFSRLFNAAAIVPKDADFTDPAYLRSMGFTTEEIRKVLHQKKRHDDQTPSGTIRVVQGGKEVLMEYDTKTGHKRVITEDEREEREKKWKAQNEVTDDDLEAFRLHDGKMAPPVDIQGKMQWAPVTAHVNMFGSPTKYVSANELTSPQWPGYNTGKRTDEWVARARREVKVEKFSKVGSRQISHAQNNVIAAFAVESERMLAETTNSLHYRACVTAMQPGDIVVLIEHCQLCHLHATTLRHKEEEYTLIADQFLKAMVETLHGEGVCARVGVLRYGTPLAAQGPPPLAADRVISEFTGTPSYSVASGARTAPRTPEGIVKNPVSPDTGGPHDHSGVDTAGFTATTVAGQDLENAPKPLSDLSDGLKGFISANMHSPEELREETKRIVRENRARNSSASRSPARHSNPCTPSKMGRLGAFEVQIIYKATDDTGGTAVVVRELLHSKLASQRWPSRSVVVRRCKAFLTRYCVPVYSSRGGKVPDDQEAGEGAVVSYVTVNDYPKGASVPLSATVLGGVNEYAFPIAVTTDAAPPGTTPDNTHNDSVQQQEQATVAIQWIYDTAEAASMHFYSAGDSVWVRHLTLPGGGKERCFLPGTIQTVDSTPGGVQQGNIGSLDVLIKYHETSVSVSAEQCVSASSAIVPLEYTKVYNKDAGMPLSLAMALYLGLPPQLQGSGTGTSAGKASSGLWRVIHRLDQKDKDSGSVSLCRHSAFHQLRNLVEQVEAKQWREQGAAGAGDNKQDTAPPGMVRAPSGDTVDLQLAYSEPVLNWLFGAQSFAGTTVARSKAEAEKTVNMGDLEALAVILHKKRGLQQAARPTPLSPAPATAKAAEQNAPPSPTYLDDAFEALSPEKAPATSTAEGGGQHPHRQMHHHHEDPHSHRHVHHHHHHTEVEEGKGKGGDTTTTEEPHPHRHVHHHTEEGDAGDEKEKEEHPHRHVHHHSSHHSHRHVHHHHHEQEQGDNREITTANTETEADSHPHRHVHHHHKDDTEAAGGEDTLGTLASSIGHGGGGSEEGEGSNDLIGDSPDQSISVSHSQSHTQGHSGSRAETEGTQEARHDGNTPPPPDGGNLSHQNSHHEHRHGHHHDHSDAAPTNKDNAADTTEQPAMLLSPDSLSAAPPPTNNNRPDLEGSMISGITGVTTDLIGAGLSTSHEEVQRAIEQGHGQGGEGGVAPVAGEAVERGLISTAEGNDDNDGEEEQPPSLEQVGKTTSQISASIAQYLEEDGNKSQSSGEMSDGAMQALMTASSPSLMARMEEEKRAIATKRAREDQEEEEEKKKTDSAPKVTIVRDLKASLTPLSVSPESSTDEEEEKKGKATGAEQGGAHTAEVAGAIISPEDSYGSDFDD